LVASRVAGGIFKRLWKLLADETETPRAMEEQRGWTEVVAATLQGAVFGAVKVFVDRAFATGFARRTGRLARQGRRIEEQIEVPSHPGGARSPLPTRKRPNAADQTVSLRAFSRGDRRGGQRWQSYESRWIVWQAVMYVTPPPVSTVQYA
jgi:Protein of unknown function (DUF4235)